MPRLSREGWLFVFIYFGLFNRDSGFYVPGVAPKEFALNEQIDVRVNYCKDC